MERALSFLIWIRRTLGAAVVIGVVIVMLHLPKPVVLTASTAPVVDEGPMPDLGGAVGWLNSEPLNRKSLRGKVLLDRGAQQSILRKGV